MSPPVPIHRPIRITARDQIYSSFIHDTAGYLRWPRSAVARQPRLVRLLYRPCALIYDDNVRYDRDLSRLRMALMIPVSSFPVAGFHLSASVVGQQNRIGAHNVAVTFDRRRISSCNCTCNSSAYWCSHVVAVCLTRIHWVST